MAEIIDEHIDGLLKATSRSFHLTLTSLPNSVRDQVGLLYLLARLADTIADSKTEDVEALIEALDGYQNHLLNEEKIDLSSVAQLQEDTDEKRLLENRKYMENVIEKQVIQQIRESMPNQSGGVNVGNKAN